MAQVRLNWNRENYSESQELSSLLVLYIFEKSIAIDSQLARLE